MDAVQLEGEIKDNQGLRRIFYRMKKFSENTADFSPLLVTSAVEGEGKTLVSIILALVFAEEIGKRCLIIDANWKKPALHSWFGLTQDNSINDILSDPERCIKKTGFEKIDLLCAPSGFNEESMRRGAGIINEMQSIKQAFSGAGKNYDLAIYDSQPVFTASVSTIDPLYIASFIKSSVMVVLTRKTDRAMVKRAKLALEDVNASLSVMLNNVYNPIYT